jgi:hypothetical protein
MIMAGLFGTLYDAAKTANGMANTTDETASHRKSNAPYSGVRREAASVAPDPATANTNRANRAADMLGNGLLGGARDAIRNTTSRRMREAGLE